jgi:hypothetical protein
MILSQVEREALRQKDRDHQWDDQIDVCTFCNGLRDCVTNAVFLTELVSTYSSPLCSTALQVHTNQGRITVVIAH